MLLQKISKGIYGYTEKDGTQVRAEVFFGSDEWYCVLDGGATVCGCFNFWIL